MSSPYGVITCDACEFETSTLVDRGRCYYIVGRGTSIEDRVCRAHTRLGWCFDCGTVSPIERFADHDALIGSLERLRDQIAQLEKMGFWETRKIGRSTKQSKLDRLRDDVAEMKAELLVLETRQSCAKCTVCGSQQHHVIPKLDEWWKTAPGSVEFRHPDCGGPLLVKESDVWISVIQEVRHLNGEGVVVYVYEDR